MLPHTAIRGQTEVVKEAGKEPGVPGAGSARASGGPGRPRLHAQPLPLLPHVHPQPYQPGRGQQDLHRHRAGHT